MWTSDLRYTVRVLRKTPLFTIAVVLTLTLGIGATTAIFSVVNAVLLQPLPFVQPDRLVWVAERNDTLRLPTFATSVLNFLSWREQSHSFEAIGTIGFASFNLSGQGDPEQLTGSTTSPAVFTVLGIKPVAGRFFRDDEERPGSSKVVIISEALWRRRYGGDPRVVGTSITLNGAPYEVVGVAPASIGVLTPGDIWVPLTIDPGRERRLNHTTFVVARLKPGVTVASAQADMDAVTRSVGTQFPEVKDWGARIQTFSQWLIGDQLRSSLLLLLGAIACVLLIACANVANLLLSRAVGREKEIATRTALGATRARLVRQLLIESVVLAVLGGVFGLALAVWGVRVMNRALPPNVLPVPDVHVNALVLLFALALTILTGVLFGLAPAWSMTKPDLNAMLKQGGRSSSGGARRLIRNSLAAGELALATMLLVGAGLLGQTLLQLQRVPIGFRPDHLLTLQISLPMAKYPLDTKAPVFYRDLLDLLRGVPGVASAAVSSGLPLGQGNYTTSPMSTIGKSVLPPDAAVPIDWRIVSSDFFVTMGVPILKGRAFTDADGANGSAVTIVSQGTATRFWGGDEPVGRIVRRVADGRDSTVIGVVGDVHDAAISQESPALYYPASARVWPRMDVVMRTVGEPSQILPGVRDALRTIDRDVPISTVRTMDEYIAANSAQPRLNAVLLGLFAAVALIVAAVGVYGVLAYSVTQRTREIGLRMALGAQRGRVLRLIVREGMTVGVIGIGVGLAGALLLGRTVASLVYNVPVRDPLTFIVVSVTLIAVALLACAMPARKASRVDPLVALRDE